MTSRILTLLASLAFSHALAAQCVNWSGFHEPVSYTTAAYAAVLVRDLDGDGAPEIITSGNQVDELNAFSLFANRGDGTFASQRLIASGFGEKLQAIGDLNGDGLPEIVASNFWSNGIAVYRNRGALAFDEGTPYGTATHGGPTLIVDYDHDGTPDVVSVSFGSGNPVRAHFFRGLGDGRLGAKTTFETQLPNGDDPSVRTAADGALEILVGVHSGHLAILRYAGGSLSLKALDAGPGVDLTSTFADVNGDGIADIIDTDDSELLVSDPAHEPIYITLADSNGSFLERKQLAQPRKIAFPVGLLTGDFDGDGHLDLLVRDFPATNFYYYKGDGAGGFAEGVPVDAGGSVRAFAVGDVNRDGRSDVVTANSDHTVSVLINAGPCPASRRRAVSH